MGTQRGSLVKTEAEVRMMKMPRIAKACQQPPEAGRNTWNRFYPRTLQKEHGPADTPMWHSWPPA